VARINAIVRRSKGHAQSIVQTGDLTINLDTKMVEINHVPVCLTGTEYRMLELLSLRKGMTISKEMFLNQLYGGMDEPEGKIIDVFICKLRKKLSDASNGKDYIETVWGRGHLLREDHGQALNLPEFQDQRAAEAGTPECNADNNRGRRQPILEMVAMG